MRIAFTLIFLLGIVAGAVGVRFGNRRLRQQKKEQLELQMHREALDHYHHELADHFARNIALLDKLTADYRLLHQQVCNPLLPSDPRYPHTFTEPVIVEAKQAQIGDDPMLVNMVPPGDYASSGSGLLRSRQQDDNRYHCRFQRLLRQFLHRLFL